MSSCRLNFAVSTAVHTLASVSWVTRQVSIKSSFSYMDNFEGRSSLAKPLDVRHAGSWWATVAPPSGWVH